MVDKFIEEIGVIENSEPLMYPYHNKIKQRIKNNEFVRYEYVDDYKNISPCMLLHFNTEPKIRPIRKHRFDEYEAYFKSL